jgi:hypothetical protein
MRKLRSLLGASPELKAIALQAEQLAQIQKKWAAIAPAPFNQHCHTGLVNNGALTLYTSSNAIAAKLKLLIPSLLKKLQKEGLEVTSIRVQVQVESKPRAPTARRQHVSQSAARKLLDLAEKLPESALQSALKKLAKRA